MFESYHGALTIIAGLETTHASLKEMGILNNDFREYDDKIEDFYKYVEELYKRILQNNENCYDQI